MKQRYTCTRIMGEGKSMEKERDTTLSQTWWRQCYGMVVYGWWWNQIIGVNWWWYSLIIFSQMLLNWSDRSNLKVKKWYVLQWPDQSPDLKPTEHAFELLNTKLNVETRIQAVTECEGSLGLEKHISIWWCPCVLDFRQSVTTKVFHASTKKNPYS